MSFINELKMVVQGAKDDLEHAESLIDDLESEIDELLVEKEDHLIKIQELNDGLIEVLKGLRKVE